MPGQTKQDARQIVLRAQSPFIGNAANEQLDVVFPRIDAEMAKLYEDRNILLTDGGIITFTGTQILFTENLNLTLNQKISGAAPMVISLGQATITLANNEMVWAVINRTAGTAALSQGLTMPAVIAANQEVFLLVKRIDAGDGTQRIYWRTGAAFNAGQSARLGSAGSGSGGSGTGDDLDALLYRASFRDGFDEGVTDSKSAVDATAGKTDPLTYSAAKAMFALNYDASKTIAAGTTTTNVNLSAVAAFTVKIGDVVVANNQARRITAVASQASFTTEAFSVAPTLAAQVTVSQAVYTKDIYNLPVDGNALSAAFSGATFSDIMVDYEDTSTVGDNIFDVNVAPVIAFSASPDGTSFTDNQNRPTLETSTVTSVTLPSAGTALYLRFFALKTSGSGSVNVLGYRAFMQKASAQTAGGIQWSAYGMLDNSLTPINCTVSVVGGKSTIQMTNGLQYGVAANPGQSFGILDVLVNGQLYPRLVAGSVSPADGYYTEVNSNTIQLDSDYSSRALDIQIILRAQIVDASSSNTTALSQLQQGQLKNYLLNGAFDIWQRNTTLTVANAASTYVADRWYVKNSLGTNGVITMSQTAGVLAGSKFGASVQITTAPTAAQANGTELYQVIENLNAIELIGQNICAMANVKALGLVTQVGIQFCYATTEIKPTLFFGTEQLVTVNASTFTLASLIAQNSGSLPTSAGVIGIRIRITAVSGGNLFALNNGFVVEQASVNLGGTLNPFYRQGRNFGEELAMCQRYFEKSLPVNVAFGTLTGLGQGRARSYSGGYFLLTELLKVVKRTNTLTVTVYNPVDGTTTWRNIDSNTNAAVLGTSATDRYLLAECSAATVNQSYTINWAVDGEI